MVVHPDDDDVVRVVGEGRRKCAGLEAEAAHQPDRHAAGAEVALDDRDLGEPVARDRVAVLDGRLGDERLGHDLVGDHADHAGLAAFPRDREVAGGNVAHPHRVLHPLGHLGPVDLSDWTPALEHGLRHERLEVREQEQVGLETRRDRAEVTQAVPGRRVQRREHERVLGGDPGGDRVAHHRVDVTVLGDVLGLAVVRAERDPLGAELLHERQQRLQVPRGRGFADQQPHPGSEALAPLLGRRGLVVGVDPGRGVGVQRFLEDARRVAVDVLGAGEPQLGQLVLVAGDDAGEVHHLGEPDHTPAAEQALEVAG